VKTWCEELGLIKIAAGAGTRTEVLEIADHFKAKTVDMTDKSMILMTTGDTEKLDAMIKTLEKVQNRRACPHRKSLWPAEKKRREE